MRVRIVLIDINKKMVNAWRSTFEENPEVEILDGSMLAQSVDAWVTPTNAKGSMDGGLDAVIKGELGQQIENKVQAAIKQSHGGHMPVGHATCVPSGRSQPKFLIPTPTMVGSSENVSDTMNVALACAAAFQAVHMQNSVELGSIQSVALPGLGANTGQVPVEICADLMWSGYSLFRRRGFESFAAMREAFEMELGDLSPGSLPTPGPIELPENDAFQPPKPEAPAPPSAKNEEVDFDDFE